jgi:hypothetical protein
MGFEEYYVGQLEGCLGDEVPVALVQLVMIENPSHSAKADLSQSARGKDQCCSCHVLSQRLRLRMPKAQESFDLFSKVQVMATVGDRELVGTRLPDHRGLRQDGVVS